MMKQLTRVVFRRWYTDLLQENLRVVPDLDPNPGRSSQDEEYGGKEDGKNEASKGPEPRRMSLSPTRGDKSLGIHKLSAEDIIRKSGSKHDL